MVETVLGALAPIVVTLLLGFVAAWRHDFEPTEATVLNRMVLLYAVPIALFVGTIGTARAELVKDVAFAVAIFVAIVGLYGLVFLLFRFVLRFSLSESVLTAMIASAPAAPFMGRPFSAICLARPAPSPSQSLLLSSTSSSRRLRFSVSRWGPPPSDRRRIQRRAILVLPKSSWKRLESRSYGRRCSLSCSCCSASASLQSSATDFR